MNATRYKWMHWLWFVIFFSLSAALGLAQSANSPVAPATVEGKILNAGLAQITVRLEVVRATPLGAADGYMASVGVNGAFRFDDVAPGRYRLVAEAPVYLRGEYGSSAPEQPGKVLEIAGGEHRKGLELTLVPDPPVLCGHVTDAAGHPVQAMVEVFGVTGTGDGPRTQVRQPARPTGKDGSFRFSNLWPQGKYFLRADGVWYPSSEDYYDAAAVEPVLASRSGCGITIRIPRARNRCDAHRVHGVIEGKLAHHVREYDVSLFATNPLGSLYLVDSHPLYRAESFEFDSVCPGKYGLVVEDRWGGNWQIFASPVFSVGDGDTTVPLTETTQKELQKLGAPADDKSASIHGELRLDGLTWDQACPQHVSQQLALLREGEHQAVFAALDRAGRFTFPNLRPGAYILTAGQIVHGATYLESFLVDGRPTEDRRIVLQAGQAANVDITIGNDPRSAPGHEQAEDSPPHYLPAGTYPPASLSGKITGVRGSMAEVELHAVRFNSARSILYTTTAAADGRFRFAALDPGIYVLSTRGKNEQYSAYGAKGPGLEGAPITLMAGERRDGFTLEAHPRSALCGRVLDWHDQPQSGVQVWAQRLPDPAHTVPLAELQSHAITDADGYFHIPDLGPGYLLLWALRGEMKTYYPSAITFGDPSGREPQYVQLGAADSDCSYEIHLADPAGKVRPSYHVRGTVEGALDPALGDRFYVSLSSDHPRSTPPVPNVPIAKDGVFDLSGVWPGTYTLTVRSAYGPSDPVRVGMCSGPPAPCYSQVEHVLGSQQITVGSADVDGIRVALQPLASLTGELLLDDQAPDPERLKKWEWVPILQKLFRNQPPAKATVSADGHFSLDMLDEGDYSFFINHFWPEFYIRSISVDGVTLEGRQFHLRFAQNAHMIVRLATDGASGWLKSSDPQPPIDAYRDLCRYFGGPVMRRLLIPDPLPPDNSGILEGSYNAAGEQSFQGVPPGKYRAVALENLRLAGWAGDGGLLKNHELMQRLALLGRPVEIAPKQHFELTAPLLTAAFQKLLAEMGIPAQLTPSY